MVIYPSVYGAENSPRIQETGKCLLVEFGILGFGIRNPTNDWNPESQFLYDKESRILNFLERNAASNARKNRSVQIKVDITILVSVYQNSNSAPLVKPESMKLL